jgi:hypothetical protein
MTPLHAVRYLKVMHFCLHKLFKKEHKMEFIFGAKNTEKNWYLESECTVPALKYTAVTYINIFLDLQPIL